MAGAGAGGTAGRAESGTHSLPAQAAHHQSGSARIFGSIFGNYFLEDTNIR